MNLYDNYSDLFLLSKLVDASRIPRPWVIHLEWSCETDDNLNFVSSQIHLHISIEYVVIVLSLRNYANSQRLIQRKQICHLFDAHDGLSDSTIH